LSYDSNPRKAKLEPNAKAFNLKMGSLGGNRGGGSA